MAEGMPLLIPFLLLAVFAFLWWQRRGSTLTRDCRWRAERVMGPDRWRCAVCGAVAESKGAPRHCLRARA